MIVDSTLGALTYQSPISFNASGDNTVVAGVVGKTFKILQLFLVMGGASSLSFKSGSNSLTGAMPMLANGSIVLDYIQLPITGVNPGESFIINSGSAVTVGGTVWYMLI